MSQKKMLIIRDLMGWFWSTFPNWKSAVSLDTDYMTDYFEKEGYSVEITDYKTFDFEKNYGDYYVLYGSAEDYCNGSKDYIEDVILHLKEQGAFLIPEFSYFRAHENKVMMEILRENFQNPELKSIHSKVWPSLEKLKDAAGFTYPVIVKKAAGAGGGGVYLAQNKKQLIRYAEKVSRMTNRLYFDYMTCVNIKQRLIGKKPVPIHNTKFITQNYIPGLEGDYKVLIFGEHYFALHRLVRKNDFRASGSGHFAEDNPKEIYRILDFAKKCKAEIDVPWLSLDICCDETACHLIEFQCITFGFKAMSMSDKHYVWEKGKWVIVEGRVKPEEEFCYSILEYINQNK